MLELLKKLFKNEGREAKKAIEIRLHDLEEWLAQSSKPLMDEVMQQAENALMKVGEESQRARLNIEALENARLQNPDIPFKAKQYMEGNRKAYVKAVSSFIGALDISNKDYFYLLGFCREFDSMINDLNKGTFRSWTILQEFFANETADIAQNLKNIDTFFKELKSILGNEKVAAVNRIAEKISSLKAKARQKISLGIELKKTEAELKLAGDEKISILSEMEKFKDSGEHKNFLNLKEEKERKAADFHSSKDAVLQSFSALEKPLRKYSHIAFGHEELALDYLKQPIEALAGDKSLEILQILEGMRNFMNDGRLRIDDKKKERSREEIKKLNKEFLEQFLKNYHSFKAEIGELSSRINASGVPERLKKFAKQLDDIDLLMKKSDGELSRLKEEASKAEKVLSEFKSGIEADVKEIFGNEIMIMLK